MRCVPCSQARPNASLRRPVNDLPLAATRIGLGMTAFTNIMADTTMRSSCQALDGSDVFFSFTSQCIGTLTVDTCSPLTNFDSTVQIMDQETGVIVACNDDACGLASSVTFQSAPGHTYLIRVGAFGGVQGMGMLNVTCNSTCPAWSHASSACPLTYNTSCLRVDFYLERIAQQFGVQGCGCGTTPPPVQCVEPPVIPQPPCASPATGALPCLRINFLFAGLLSAADPQLW
jgi:hypothetical protein